MPEFLVTTGVEQRTCLIEERTGLQGHGSQASGTSCLTGSSIVLQRTIANRQMRSNLVTLFDHEVEHVLSRCTPQGVCLVGADDIRVERHIAIVAYQLEIEVSTQEAHLIRQTIEAGHLVGVVLVELILREVTVLVVGKEVVGLANATIEAKERRSVVGTERAVGEVVDAS